MRELSLNILDIAQNSVVAGAKNITITVKADTKKNSLKIIIGDDGCGMDKEFLAKVTDPFSTTRTTRKVGLGLPLFKMAAESAGGALKIDSTKGKGTVVTADFQLNHIDRMPLGDIGETILTLISGSPKLNFVFTYGVDGREFILDTDEVRTSILDAPIDSPEIMEFLRDYLTGNIAEANENEVL